MRVLGRFLQGFFTRFVIALVVAGAVTGGAVLAVNKTIDQKLDRAERVDVVVATPPAEGANYLLIGSDTREGVDNDLEREAFGEDQGGQLSDTMMVVHVEPGKQRSFVVSFPRDLMVEIPGYGTRQINSAYGLGGPQLIIDTLESNFGFEIHHYVEVGLLAFVDMVNAIGTVPVYLPGLVRDEYTGFALGVYGPGCYELDGEQALQFVRARHMEQFDPATGEFELIDDQADINRIDRQQQFIKQLASLAVKKGFNNPLTANKLADGILEHLVLDREFSRDDMFGLLNAFKDVDPNDPRSLEMTTIPWQPYEAEAGRLEVDEFRAEPVLARLRDFGGELTPDVVPAQVQVQVLNGTAQVGLAEQMTYALGAAGFQTVPAGEAYPTGTTQILYAPGAGAGANLVKSFLNGFGATVEDPNLGGATVVVVIGDDYLVAAPPAPASPPTTAPVPPAPVDTTALGAVQLVSALRPAQEIPPSSAPPPSAPPEEPSAVAPAEPVCR